MEFSRSNVKKILYFHKKSCSCSNIKKILIFLNSGTLHFQAQTHKYKKSTRKKCLISPETEVSSSNIIKNSYIFPKRKLFLHFRKHNFLAQVKTKFLHFLKRKLFLYFL